MKHSVRFCGRNVRNASDCFSTILHESGISFEWPKRFKEGRESVRDDERCGRSKKVNRTELIGQRVRVRVTMLNFYGSSRRDSVGRGQHFSNRVSTSTLQPEEITSKATRVSCVHYQ